MSNGGDDDGDIWGDEEEEKIFAFIQESDYANEGVTSTTATTPVNSLTACLSKEDYSESRPKRTRLDADELLTAELPVHEFGYNPTELKNEVLNLRKKLEDAVSLNTDLKNQNYQLQGEAGTLRRRLDQENMNKQQLICQRIQNMHDAKSSVIEERKKLQREIETLKANLSVSRAEIHTLEEKNRRFLKRTSVSSPSICLDTTSIPRDQSAVLNESSLVHNSQPQSSRQGRPAFPTRQSFFAKEVRAIPSAVTVLPQQIEKDSKEVQTEEFTAEPAIIPQPVGITPPSIYDELKTSTRRLIALEIQILKPVVDKTVKYARSAFRRRLKQRMPRFGLGLEAFDSTALMLQWMDENEMEEFDESEDLQGEYVRRLDKIYDSKADGWQYPAFEEHEAESEVWEDSEKMVGSNEEEEQEDDDSSASSESPPGKDSDTSEDEYELEDSDKKMQSQVQNNLHLVPESQTLGLPSAQMPLTFLKDFKLKSRLLTHRYNYKYLKHGQPLEVVLKLLDGVYDEGGVWNTLYFIKNELRFLLDEKDLYQSNRFHVFTTLLVWLKNLWGVVTAVENQEQGNFGDSYNRELFGWTDLLTKIVWRSTKSLVHFCRALRSIYLSTLAMIIQSGFFDASAETYRRIYLTLLDSIQNSIHHKLENSQLVLEICIRLPRAKILKYVCRTTLPAKICNKRCLLKEIAERICTQFQTNTSLPLFEKFLDLMQRLDQPSPRNLAESMMAGKKRPGEPADSSQKKKKIISELNIFKEPQKCECRTAFIQSFLSMLSQVWQLWKERYRELEFKALLGDGEDHENVDTSKNIYTDVIVRSFEFLYCIYKFSENIGRSYGNVSFTKFWDVIASYRRYMSCIPLRPDMVSVLKYMSHDEEDELQKDRQGVKFPEHMEHEWYELITQFPDIQLESSKIYQRRSTRTIRDEDKEN